MQVGLFASDPVETLCILGVNVRLLSAQVRKETVVIFATQNGGIASDFLFTIHFTLGYKR